MPPKKKGEVQEERVILGRLSHSLSCGIVGLPNAGKSTFFNILTKSQVPAEAFPFCTIDPNSARVAVPDDRFDFLVEHYHPASVVPAFLNVTDIAGLVRGASQGEGLGNAFLSHIRACDGIIHLVRGFEDPDIPHVEQDVNPVRDLEIIRDELLQKDIDTVRSKQVQLQAVVDRGIAKDKKAELEIVNKIMTFLEEEKKEIRFGEWKAVDVEVLNQMQLLTAKPAQYLINISESDFERKRNKWLKPVSEWIQANSPGELLIPFSAAFEQKLVDMPADERAAYLAEHPGVNSVLPKITKTVYHMLNLVHYFTAGEDEVKAWTIRAGTKAPQAAGRIHGDFEKGFICAEVIQFDDFKELGSESAVKAAGKMRQQGRQYEVLDGDIILFRFNVGGGDKKKK